MWIKKAILDIILLTKIINELYKKSKYQNTFKNQEENQFVEKTLNFLNKFVYNLNALVETNEKKSKNKLILENNHNSYNNNNCPYEVKYMGNNYGATNNITTLNIANNNIEDTNSSSNNHLIDVKDKITKNLKKKQSPFLSKINPLVYFIIKEDKEKFTTLTFDDYTAFEIARFIRTNLRKLNGGGVDDYFCSGKPFNIKNLTYFINSFDFSNHNILDAMRVLFYELPSLEKHKL